MLDFKRRFWILLRLLPASLFFLRERISGFLRPQK
jgi:hypothetical protein